MWHQWQIRTALVCQDGDEFSFKYDWRQTWLILNGGISQADGDNDPGI